MRTHTPPEPQEQQPRLGNRHPVLLFLLLTIVLPIFVMAALALTCLGLYILITII